MRVAVDDLSQFLAAPPPRDIPPAIRSSRLPQSRLAVAALVTALTLAVAMPFAVQVFPDRLLEDLRLDLGDPALTAGTIEAIEDTGLFAVGSADDRRPIRRIRFRFQVGAETHTAASHTDDATLAIGDPGLVEFLAADPEIARLQHTRRSRTPRIGAAVALLPLVPLGWLAMVWNRRRRVRHLLRHGRFTFARIDSYRRAAADATTVIRDVAILAIPLFDGRELRVERAPTPIERPVFADRHARGARIGVLHDPDDPRRFVVTDTLLAATSPTTGASDRDHDAYDDDAADADDPPPGEPLARPGRHDRG